jgi:GNAT superfamily N-acetyltransferase
MKLSEIHMMMDFPDLVREPEEVVVDDFTHVDTIAGNVKVFQKNGAFQLAVQEDDKNIIVGRVWASPITVGDTKGYFFRNIRLYSGYRGHGIGYEFYKFFLKRYKVLFSDFVQTEESRAIWKKLARDFDVKIVYNEKLTSGDPEEAYSDNDYTKVLVAFYK